MIENDDELRVMLERMARFQNQVAHLRQTEPDPANYHVQVDGFLAEIVRMQLEIRDYLSTHPADPDTEMLWSVEIARRIGEADAGNVRPIPWSVVRQRLQL